MNRKYGSAWVAALAGVALLAGQPYAAAEDRVVVVPLFGCMDCGTAVPTVTSAGQVWMDRNLGAFRVAQSANDYQAYGWLYQWGRGADGHEMRNSATTSINSGSDVPGHGDFIVEGTFPSDWRVPQNNSLWQGVNGINNPCPPGFRLPTATEWQTQRSSWSSTNAAGAFASPLRLVAAGYRRFDSGTIANAGLVGQYWSSTVNGALSRYTGFSATLGVTGSVGRAYGHSVRCIED